MSVKPKRILVFSPLYPPHIGGLERHAQQWNQAMAARGWLVTVWTPHLHADAPMNEDEGNVKVVRYPAWEIVAGYPVPHVWRPRFWRQLHQLRMLCSPLQKTIVVSRTRFFVSTLMAALFAKTHKLPHLHVEHGSDFVHSTNVAIRAVARAYDYTIGRQVLRSATVVVANSNASATFVQRLSGRRTDAVIYRGVADTAIETIPAAARTSSSVVITYVGRLISGKGVHDLLTALALLPDVAWQAWIIGDGPARPALQQQVRRLRLMDRLRFVGEATWSETLSLIKASDIIVNPSYTEGLPTSLIEAALCRRAIVATAVGGTPEIVQQGVSALLVQPGDPRGLAQALHILLHDRARAQQLGQAAYHAVASRFSWRQSAAHYQRILEQL